MNGWRLRAYVESTDAGARPGTTPRAAGGCGRDAVRACIHFASAQHVSTPESEAQVGVLDTEPVLIACDENVTVPEGSEATVMPAVSPTTTYSLLAEESVARYRVMEELATRARTRQSARRAR